MTDRLLPEELALRVLDAKSAINDFCEAAKTIDDPIVRANVILTARCMAQECLMASWPEVAQ